MNEYMHMNTLLTKELHSEQVITELFGLLRTAADESREIVFPVIPVDLLPAVIGE